MLERSTLRSLGLLALFCGRSALAGSESAATGKVESIETSVCRLIESSARTQSLPVAFLTRLIWQESSFRPNTISPAGAQSIAQFMPKTADERGLANPFIPKKQYQNPPAFSPTSSSVSAILDWPPPTMPVLPVLRTGSPGTAICRPRPGTTFSSSRDVRSKTGSAMPRLRW
jgi:Transglycosylase SLT domain